MLLPFLFISENQLLTYNKYSSYVSTLSKNYEAEESASAANA
jgi:hypothetical protein